MTEWPKLPLSDLCDPMRGITYGIVKVGDFVPGGIPVIRGGDIRSNRIVFNDEKRVTRDVSDQYKRTILRGGELVINLIAEPGHSAIVPPEMAGFNVSRDVAVISLNGMVNHSYVNWYLKSPEAVEWLTARLSGSVTQKINLGVLREVPVAVPEKAYQDRLVRILEALDDKIAVNWRIAVTTSELAAAYYLSTPGWRSVKISDVAHVTMGQSPPGETFNEQGSGLPFYQGTRDFGFRFPGYRVWCTAVTRQAEANDVLVSVRAPVGQINVAAEPCGIGRGVASVRSDKYPHVLLQALSADGSIWLPYEAEGTVFGSINKKQLTQLEIGWPTAEFIDSLESRLSTLDQRIRRATEESHTLEALRDTLLPQLMSGKLRVRDAEKIVEDAV